MAEVESFTLDHTAVKAPYVRLINVESGPKGDQISNFDVRFVQPNSGEIPTSGLHTIEHLLASLLRDRIDGGHSFEDIVAEMTAFIARMKTRFVLEDLSNLVKNGRISKVAGLLSGMLSLRPIMGDDGHGSIAAIEKVRGTQNAMRRLVELIAEGTREAAASSLTMVLSYCNCPERAMMLKKEFLEKCAALREVILVPTSGLSTVYAYDGGIVLAY